VLRKLVIGVAVIATLVAGVGTARLVLDPTGGVIKQLAFLRAEIEDGADRAAQKQFPEGYFFLNVLYGLSWVQVGLDDPAQSADATAEVRWSLDRLAATDGTAPFDESLQPQYGVFYAGWTNWLRGGQIALGHSDAADLATFTTSRSSSPPRSGPRGRRSSRRTQVRPGRSTRSSRSLLSASTTRWWRRGSGRSRGTG
jgi:hypothetical protein